MTFLTKLLGRPKKEKPLPSAPPSRSTPKRTAAEAENEVQEAMLLRGLTSPDEYRYRLSLKVGDMVDVEDKAGRWRVAEVVHATSTHVQVKFVDTAKTFDLTLHRGGARIAHPLTKAAKSPLPSSSPSPSPSSPPPRPSAAPRASVHLHVQPTLASMPSIQPPLTPWSPSTVDYSLTPTCIVHRPPPPLLTPHSPGHLRVIPMAKDNSCLYHSIAYVCDGQLPRKGLHVMQQRLRAHSLVTADPATYTAVVLGCDVAVYCRRLLDLATWGGAIELGLFSSLYEVEIFAFDFTQPTVYRFGDMHGYRKRVMLVYSGSHYEALGYVEGGREGEAGGWEGGKVQEVFDTQDDEALARAQKLVEQLYLARRKAAEGSQGSQQQPPVVWAGQGVYELKQRARQLVTKLLSPRNRRASASALSPPPPPLPPRSAPSALNTSPPPPMRTVSVPTPLSSHARRSSFTFGQAGGVVRRVRSPPVMEEGGRSVPEMGEQWEEQVEGGRRGGGGGSVDTTVVGERGGEVGEGEGGEVCRSPSLSFVQEQPGLVLVGGEEEKERSFIS